MDFFGLLSDAVYNPTADVDAGRTHELFDGNTTPSARKCCSCQGSLMKEFYDCICVRHGAETGSYKTYILPDGTTITDGAGRFHSIVPPKFH